MFEGKKVALLATGGGGKGIAHIGVMSACEQLGIKFDFMIGASAGAIAVVFYSQYRDIDKVIDHFRPRFKRKYSFEQFGWGKMLSTRNLLSRSIKSGLFDLSAAEEYFRRILTVNDFDKLEFPVYISATNLNTNTGILLGPGLEPKTTISQALVASCCIPVLFRPVRIGPHYYVDGEIKRPMSIQSAFEFGADVVIVSDMYAPNVNGLGTSSMLNIAGQIANMMLQDKSYRGIEFVKVSNPDKQVFLVSPETGDASVFSTSSSYEKLIDAGYNAALQTLQRNQEVL